VGIQPSSAGSSGPHRQCGCSKVTSGLKRTIAIGLFVFIDCLPCVGGFIVQMDGDPCSFACSIFIHASS
jgi:hypothetical protein